MTHATDTTGTAFADDDVRARRARGIALVAGAVLIVALIETETIPFYWFPTLTGLTYLAAAVAGRSRGTLWGPGFVVTSVGLGAAFWLRDGRMPDSFQFLALAVMALGLGGVLAALLTQVRGFSISAMSVAMPVLLFGVSPCSSSRWSAPSPARPGSTPGCSPSGAPTSCVRARSADRADSLTASPGPDPAPGMPSLPCTMRS